MSIFLKKNFVTIYLSSILYQLIKLDLYFHWIICIFFIFLILVKGKEKVKVYYHFFIGILKGFILLLMMRLFRLFLFEGIGSTIRLCWLVLWEFMFIREVVLCSLILINLIDLRLMILELFLDCSLILIFVIKFMCLCILLLHIYKL